MSEVATLDQIKRLQEAASKLPQIELKTDHYWADGMYMRSLFRPKDTLIIGKVHRREHFYLVLSGDVTIQGDGYKERVKAPHIFVSAPGTKRAVYAHEDSLCVTIHRTDSTDLDEIEAELIEPDEAAMYDAQNQLKQDLKEIE
jgi:hypothetical protein